MVKPWSGWHQDFEAQLGRKFPGYRESNFQCCDTKTVWVVPIVILCFSYWKYLPRAISETMQKIAARFHFIQLMQLTSKMSHFCFEPRKSCIAVNPSKCMHRESLIIHQLNRTTTKKTGSKEKWSAPKQAPKSIEQKKSPSIQQPCYGSKFDLDDCVWRRRCVGHHQKTTSNLIWNRWLRKQSEKKNADVYTRLDFPFPHTIAALFLYLFVVPQPKLCVLLLF